MTHSNKEKVTGFLIDTKSLLEKGNWFFSPRKKNLDALAKEGLTIYNAKDIIFSLSYCDYVKGPEKDIDENFPGYIWVFGKTIGTTDFYIKLKTEEGVNGLLVCLSFHDTKEPLKYPLNKSNG